MKIYLNFTPTDWNTYINAERTNKFKASKIKKDEMQIIKYLVAGRKYKGNYPVKLIITNYFKDKRKDLDNTNLKILIDGLVKSGVIKNDNLTCITDIELHSVISKEKSGIEVEILEVK